MNVKIIRQSGAGMNAVALVEWIDGSAPRRVTVPADRIHNDECDMGTLVSGVPYGESWELHITPVDLPDVISDELRKRGLWTKADVLARPDEAHSAVLTAVKTVNLALLRYVREA